MTKAKKRNLWYYGVMTLMWAALGATLWMTFGHKCPPQVVETKVLYPSLPTGYIEITADGEGHSDFDSYRWWSDTEHYVIMPVTRIGPYKVVASLDKPDWVKWGPPDLWFETISEAHNWIVDNAHKSAVAMQGEFIITFHR